MSEITDTKSIADHFAEHVERQPDAPALIWDGEAISYRELADAGRRAPTPTSRRRTCPTTARSGIRAKKSPEAIALDPGVPAVRRVRSCCRRSSSRRRRSRSCSRRRARARCSRPTGPRSSAASLRALVDETRAEDDAASEWPPAEGGRRRHVHAHHLGLDRACPRSCRCRRAASTRFTDWAAEQFEIRPGTVVANYAPLNFDLCLLDIWTTLKHGGCVAMVDQDRATQGAYLADLRQRQRGQRAAGGARCSTAC